MSKRSTRGLRNGRPHRSSMVPDHGVEIVKEFPPNVEDIYAELPFNPFTTVFAHEGTIYAPGGVHLDPWLVAHEQVHFRQQDEWSGGCEQWWEDYLQYPEMRFWMELEAHAEEYAVFCAHKGDRNVRAMCLMRLAQRLLSPTYGNLEYRLFDVMGLIKNGTQKIRSTVAGMVETSAQLEQASLLEEVAPEAEEEAVA
jgi:hypothetical protein